MTSSLKSHVSLQVMALNEQLNEVGGVLSSLLNSPLHRILHTAQISALTGDTPTLSGTGGRADPITLSSSEASAVSANELESSSEFVRGSRSNWPRLRRDSNSPEDSDEVPPASLFMVKTNKH